MLDVHEHKSSRKTSIKDSPASWDHKIVVAKQGGSVHSSLVLKYMNDETAANDWNWAITPGQVWEECKEALQDECPPGNCENLVRRKCPNKGADVQGVLSGMKNFFASWFSQPTLSYNNSPWAIPNTAHPMSLCYSDWRVEYLQIITLGTGICT